MTENKIEKMEVKKMDTYYPHSDSAVVYYRVENVLSNLQIKREVKNYGIDNGIPTIFDDYYKAMNYSAYDCTGQWFSSGIKLIGYDENYRVAIVALYYSQDV